MAVFDQGYALIIGAGGDLPNTVDDAMGLGTIFQDTARCAYLPEHVTLLTQQQATRENILAAFDRLAQIADARFTVVVYFSGHGYRVESPMGEFYYLLPYGYDLDRLFKTAISGAEWTARLQAIRSQKLLVLLDCCHAGGVGEDKSPGLRIAKSPLPPEARSLLAEGSGRVIVASSREDDLSFAGKPYSAFTLALIEALSGMGVSRKDGYVRVTDLALHAREVVPGRTGGRQHPILHMEQADNFVLAYYAGGETVPKGVPFAAAPEIEPEPGAWTLSNVITGGTFEGLVAVGGGDAIDRRQIMQNSSGGQMINFGDISGQAAVSVGTPAVQPQAVNSTAAVSSTAPDWPRLWQLLATLKAQMSVEAPPEQKEAALAEVGKLEQAVFASPPNLAAVQKVSRWFAKNLSWMSRSVADVVTFIQSNLF